MLATGTFDSESATGWQTLTLDVPVTVTAGTTYVASYFAPQGHYAADVGLLRAARTHRDRCTVPAAGERSATCTAPVAASRPDTWNSSNYWVGVIFRTP